MMAWYPFYRLSHKSLSVGVSSSIHTTVAARKGISTPTHMATMVGLMSGLVD